MRSPRWPPPARRSPRKALKLIKVDYEILPHVIDVDEAMERGAPLLHEDMITAGVEPPPTEPSNVAKRVEFALGDTGRASRKADIVVEREFTTKAVHQGYIEPHACVASWSEDGQAELWCSTQGHFIVRAHCAKLLGMDISRLRVTASEIGGGFGGKTVVYLEPVALALSRKSRHPVKMVMSREEVFKATGPTSGAHVWVKIGANKDGRITAGEAVLKYQAGAFQGTPVQPGAMSAFAPYDLENVKVVGYDVVTNRPKVAAYRAPGAPIAEFAVESVIDEIAQEARHRSDRVPPQERGQGRHASGLRPALRPDRPDRDPGGGQGAPALHRRRSGPTRAAASPPASGSTSAARPPSRSTSTRTARSPWSQGTPDIGGSRASMLPDGGGGAGHRVRQGARDHRRHLLARLHLPDRRQPRDLRDRHGGQPGGGRG